MKRAFYVVDNLKTTETADRFFIDGVATSGSVDRLGDIVVPEGVKSESDIPLFLYHDSWQTVGRATLGKAGKGGIPFRAWLPKLTEPGRLKERVDEAIQLVKHRLVTGVSIGFDVLNDAWESIKGTSGYRFLETEVLELSIVPIPANRDATIATVKSLVERPPAAMGRSGPPPHDRNRPGASGQRGQPESGPPGNPNRSRKGDDMKTLKELREARNTKTARLQELSDTRKQENRGFSDEEREEWDGLSDEVRGLEDEIREAEFTQMQTRGARPVGGSNEDEGSASRSRSAGSSSSGAQQRSGRANSQFSKQQDPDDAFPGQSFVRQIIAKAVARLTDRSAVAVAEERWQKSNPKLVAFIRANVAGGGTGSGEWGAELAAADTRYNGDFIDYLYGLTIFDQLPLRVVPENVHIKGQDGVGTGYWVGESKAIPATTLDFSDVTLTGLKVAALCAVSNDLLMKSEPSAEMLIRDALAEACAQRVDTTFLGAGAAVAGVSPAGILNGLAAISSNGSDADGLRADVAALLAPFIAAKNASGLIFVTNPSLATGAGLLVNALGQIEFAGMNGDAPQLFNRRVWVGDNVGAGDLILMKPSDIWRIGDRGVQVSLSRDATIEQTDAPANASDTPVAAAGTLVSMFQTESTAFKVVRRISFAKRRASAVAFVGNAAYGPPAGS
jgi:HK97 family phage prohead protease